MTEWEEKARVVVGGLALEIPARVARGRSASIDSAAAVFEGEGLTVIVDEGPFADRLDSHVGRPEYEERTRDVAGSPARVVSFRSPEEGSFSVAVHVAAPVPATVFVRADESVPEEVARRIVESLEPADSSTEEGNGDG